MSVNLPIAPRTAIVTGANSGVGYGVCQRLAEQGWRVVMLCRDEHRGTDARDALRTATGNDAIDLILADLTDYASVRAFAHQVLERYDSLDVLVNAAGLASMRRVLTGHAHELTLAAGFIGPALLTRLLLDRLTQGQPGRVVNVSGNGHRYGKLALDDLHFGERRYTAARAGTQAVLAKLLFTYELARRAAPQGVTANACCPGLVRSNLLRDASPVIRAVLWPYLRLKGQTPYEGAATPAHLATAPELAGVTGQYWRHLRALRSSDTSYDAALAGQLWDAAVRLADEAR
ncbi:MAG: retinol dehydrogenase-14 [Myxococcota bacterium]|jgi:retinol dehydrogenase-14